MKTLSLLLLATLLGGCGWGFTKTNLALVDDNHLCGLIGNFTVNESAQDLAATELTRRGKHCISQAEVPSSDSSGSGLSSEAALFIGSSLLSNGGFYPNRYGYGYQQPYIQQPVFPLVIIQQSAPVPSYPTFGEIADRYSNKFVPPR